MGCDIHEAIEIQIDGKWVYAGGIDLDRNYLLFGVLAGVRNEDVECVTGFPKDLPENLSEETKEIIDQWEGCGHSHSYLDLEELEQAKEIYDKQSKYIFPKALQQLKELKQIPFVEDVRFIFWFDN